MKSKTSNTSSVTTIFYDGWCRLCSGVVGVLMKTKSGRRFTYVPIQQIDDYIDDSLATPNAIDGNEIVVYVNQKLVKGADAVLLILNNMGGVYKLLSKVLNILPSRWLNGLYSYMANNRYRWFGKRTSCEIG
ncbi:thiol-disulfide oxidoreductase DCC family protein [Carboxylicivirga linearis]|uniref:DUF393 domain-containing protein n=1 Tax=Carboxylicivirga linearis TaxID=1628157 RepID=A0ABS5JQP2_9BACT|nr:DCC1-like thiol-disulfide oxidoreductase family protein [Carboxylicivirga linearis]MBS2097118.1 DUF393 domain-containing protein [Carboxylicivirga linearis]